MHDPNIEEIISIFGGMRNLRELLEKDIIQFSYDFVPFSIKFNKEGDKIDKNKVKILAREYVQSPQESFLEELHKLNKYHISQNIENLVSNVKVLPHTQIKNEEINNILFRYLNDKKIFNSYLDINNKYYIFKERIQNMNYEVIMDDDYFILETNNGKDNDMYNILKGILFSNYAISILSGYYDIKLAEYCNSNIFTNEVMQTILYKEYKDISNDKNADRFNNILKFEDIRDFGELYDKDNFKNILDIREKAHNLRKFISEMKSDDSIDNIKEYLKKLEEEVKIINSLPVKAVSFLVGCGCPAFAFVDTFCKDRITNMITKNKSIRLDNIFKRK
ncbi:hypothetical protein [Tepidibacter mesophilus]|uniref:hypothetical protein n=1 Tax=Tepidibacter mesophilus TaxID=655607 RepID=UPI000C08B011|nr:hypothetical protein [Tepidibacter mesophilus]